MSCRFTTSANTATAIFLLVAVSGCTEVRGRKKIQEANELYKRGKYAEAVAVFDEAAELVPNLPTLWLNKGYTCRQLIAPGGKDPESRRAAACALEAFGRLARAGPGRSARRPAHRSDLVRYRRLRGAGGDVPGAPSSHAQRLRRRSRLAGGLSTSGASGAQALEWSKRAAALRPNDAETQYGVGTFIWQVLSARGGGAEMATYDPRPRLPPEAETAAEATGKKKGKPAPAPVPPRRRPPRPSTTSRDRRGSRSPIRGSRTSKRRWRCARTTRRR